MTDPRQAPGSTDPGPASSGLTSAASEASGARREDDAAEAPGPARAERAQWGTDPARAERAQWGTDPARAERAQRGRDPLMMLACVALGHLAEPGNRDLGQLVRRVGPVEAVGLLHHGEVGGRLGDVATARLGGADPYRLAEEALDMAERLG